MLPLNDPQQLREASHVARELGGAWLNAADALWNLSDALERGAANVAAFVADARAAAARLSEIQLSIHDDRFDA